jgi:hypothetical protein
MKRLALATSALLVIAVSACGRDTYASLAREGHELMKEMVATIEKITDASSARAQKPALQAIVKKFENLDERRKKLPEPSEADMKALEESMSKEMQETLMKLQGAMMKIMFDPAISAELKDIDFQRTNK